MQNALGILMVTAPQLALTALALLVLLLDVTLMRPWDTERRTRWLGAITSLGLVAVLVIVAFHWGIAGSELGPLADVERILVLDHLNVLLTGFIIVITLGTVIISIGYDFTAHVGEYFCVTIFAAIGMTLVVSTENLLMFLVGIELLSVCLYILTAFHKGVLRSAEAAVKYFMFGALSSAFLLFGLSYVVGVTGATHVSELAQAVSGDPHVLVVVGMLFIIVGIAFKIAVVPFHLWAPDAYEGAPTPVVAFIATGSKVASFVIAAKIFVVGFHAIEGSGTYDPALGFQAGWVLVLSVIAAASMIWGNVAAIAQKNAKRMLAYSSVAHAGYILTGLVVSTSMGMSAFFYYLVAYSLTNLGAFGVVAALTRHAGGDDIDDFDGMIHRAPLLSFLLMIFVLSLAGIPPLAGFFGKLYLFGAAMNGTPPLGLMWLVVVAIATSAVSLYYYVNLLRHVFVVPAKRADPIKSPLHWTLTLTILAIVVVVIGVHPQPVITLFNDAARGTVLDLSKPTPQPISLERPTNLRLPRR